MSTHSLGALGLPTATTLTAGATAAPAASAHPAEAATLWRPSAPCTPHACVQVTGPARARPLAVLRIAAVLALLVAGFLVTPLGGRIPAGLVRRWCLWVVRAAGVRVRIDGGAAPDGGLLLVANHVSWLDIPLLAAVRPARMVAKSEIRQWPVAGWLTARSGALFIDRDRIRALPETVGRIAEALRAGEAVALFPEGSTWCGRAQGHFRRAAFQAALDAGVPVQPVRLRYRTAQGAPSTAAAFVGEDSLLTSVWRVVRARELVAEVEVPEPIAPGSRPDRRSLARAAEVSALLGARQVQVPGPRRTVPFPAPGVVHTARAADTEDQPPAPPREALTA
ncbi:lysophospholipid acyltransferase family protein [Streptomyces cyaneus]|uniref:lysophospholipid acyltransferase family protein n=1 Tax=Streptomyces cyaneus TaxID=1904 RepID=UPI000FF87A27|nr:lysophospholipid acyltransferase family protein [Streptomyces cyaneus]